jgi:hypothetical protein
MRSVVLQVVTNNSEENIAFLLRGTVCERFVSATAVNIPVSGTQFGSSSKRNQKILLDKSYLKIHASPSATHQTNSRSINYSSANQLAARGTHPAPDRS